VAGLVPGSLLSVMGLCLHETCGTTGKKWCDSVMLFDWQK
jgi:hypothetical protein